MTGVRSTPITVRTVRLGSGLVLFVYLAFHLLDHSLLNVSIAWAETMLHGMKDVWQSPPGAVVLYSAMTTHLLLAFWALYERRQFQWRASEAAQLVLGFCIPVLLANHILATRVSLSLFDTQKGYPIELYSFWVGNIPFGIVQHVVLAVAWAHGCLGMYFWLRLKRWFPSAAPLLLSVAVLLPVLALLGSFQGGRTVQALRADPAWVAANLMPANTGAAAQNAWLGSVRGIVWYSFGAAILLVLAARGVRTLRERQRGLVRISYVDGKTIRVRRGLSVLEASRLHRVPHTSICGGRGRCTTCRVRLFGNNGVHAAPEPGEAAALNRIGAEPDVRLACQFRPISDVNLSLIVPPAGSRRRKAVRGGEEQYVILMFVDMRGSTALAEGRLPFDTVFVVNSFLSAVGRAVVDAGGESNQVLGDGLMCLFGLNTDPEKAARQALAAAAGIARNVAALNVRLEDELASPLRFGIGINGGKVIVGDIGHDDFMVFTALGDPVNVAARLESMTKDYKCELLVTDEVYRAAGREAGREAGEWPLHVVSARGREGALAVRAATAAMLEGEAAGGAVERVAAVVV